MSILRRYLLHNWWLKLLALLLALLLWSAVTGEPPTEVGYAVPLELRNVSANVEVAGDVPPTVRVWLRGSAPLVRRLVPADIVVAIDLLGRSPGEYVFQLKPSDIEVPYGTRVVRLSPSEVRLRLVRRPGPLG
jgi:YbbR domain-containing protein